MKLHNLARQISPPPIHLSFFKSHTSIKLQHPEPSWYFHSQTSINVSGINNVISIQSIYWFCLVNTCSIIHKPNSPGTYWWHQDITYLCFNGSEPWIGAHYPLRLRLNILLIQWNLINSIVITLNKISNGTVYSSLVVLTGLTSISKEKSLTITKTIHSTQRKRPILFTVHGH